MSDTATLVLFIGWGVIVVVAVITLFQVRKQHLATNSRLDALLDATRKLARSEGYEAGRESMTRLRETSAKIDHQGS
jgi:hypothetical protein